MFSPLYRRLYHFHLKKTGGSTLNRWLDTLGHDDAAGFAALLSRHWRMDMTSEAPKLPLDAMRGVFYCADVVHTHAPLRRILPPHTLCCTFLREPGARLVSQINDFRRLTADDIARTAPSLQALIRDAGRLPPRDYLERYGRTEGRLLFDNFMTRSLAAARAGRAA